MSADPGLVHIDSDPICLIELAPWRDEGRLAGTPSAADAAMAVLFQDGTRTFKATDRAVRAGPKV